MKSDKEDPSARYRKPPLELLVRAVPRDAQNNTAIARDFACLPEWEGKT